MVFQFLSKKFPLYFYPLGRGRISTKSGSRSNVFGAELTVEGNSAYTPQRNWSDIELR